MIRNKKIIVNQSLTEHFANGIVNESKDLLPPLTEDAVHYITTILIRYSESRELFIREDDLLKLPTLALLYKDASNALSSYERNIILRKLGDSALFMGALFYEYFAKRGIRKDYFIGMGGSAYSSLGDFNYGNRDTFYELAEKFPKLLEVISNVCMRKLQYDAQDIFALIERWQNSRDELIRKQLQSIGIMPTEFSARH